MKKFFFFILFFSDIVFAECVVNPTVNISYNLSEVITQGTVIDSCKSVPSYYWGNDGVTKFTASEPTGDGSCYVTYIKYVWGPECTGCTDTVPDGFIEYPMEYGSCKNWDDLNSSVQAQYAPGTTGGAPICNSCYAPAKATCSNDEILNSNNDCVPLQHSAGFPDSTKKGIPKFLKDNNLSPEECIAGQVYENTINYAKIINYDYGGLYDPAGCMFEVFYCNDGLTWNKTAKTCEVPKDTESSDTVSDYISDDTKAACTSGLWAKSWTYDYCNQPLCYISLDIQDYNLQCNNKYIEYDCTSDYRVKTFKQVSCGEIAKSDFSTTDLQITPTTQPDPPTDTNNDINITRDSNVTSTFNIDTNATVTDYSGVVGIINGSLDKVDSSLQALIGQSQMTNQKLSDANSKLGSIDNKLGSIDGKLEDIDNSLKPLRDIDSLSKDSSSLVDSFNNVLNEGFNTYLNRDYTNGLASSSCGVVPTYSIVFHGRTIVFFSQDLLNVWPLEIFRTMIIFMFVFSGVIMAFRTS
ncbi:hypothetical protein LCX93_11060 [Sulfurimonas sp. SWIR-19]|uniref:hypothetical protein n=1 Tax=Sulfurimonas sp. SWIR-19 TaxID=2878390 RepID=UPI001CF331A8|nr:hypothetical protein [Sulfurimonas sp. SWIR-19]UCN00054.1 hypothetical protein LCX93_11060 [Sulfurimonas sp. SWIR-19]